MGEIVMKVLIIAAGQGSRLNGLRRNNVKPLTRLLGISLIERAIFSAKRAGIFDFVIVVGYNGGMIKNELGDGKRYGVNIEYVENNEWQRGNGVSVLKARDRIKGKFILMMCDHVFDPEILNKLKAEEIEDGCLLCIDRQPRWYIDMEDATKVKLRDGYIEDIDKGLKDYDAVDCGIFLCTPEIFDALAESIKNGDESLSAGIRVLARKGKARVFDITGSFWIDIDTPTDLKNAEHVMLNNLIKPTDGPISRHLNRKISLRMSRFILNRNITPNLISLLSFIMGIASAVIFSMGSYITTAIGGVLAQLSSIVDGCDGELARIKFMESKHGGWLDAVFDRYADALIIFGMIYGYWQLAAEPLIWILGLFALFGSFMISYTADKYKSIAGCDMRIERFKIPISRDVRLFLIMLGALANQIPLTLGIIAVFAHIETVRRVIFVLSLGDKKKVAIYNTHVLKIHSKFNYGYSEN